MSIRDVKGEVDDLIPVQTVLLSVSDKTGLTEFAQGLVGMNPEILLLSTGGTYTALAQAVPKNLVEVAKYTEFPEMEGGLVKTLHPKIHAGLLGERNNSAHQEYLKQTLGGAKFIDMVVVNLYPFAKKISEPNVTFEGARGNVDIGGPTMLRAAAKNFLSCAPVCDPTDYGSILQQLEARKGFTTFDQRFGLMQKVFAQTAKYDADIAGFMARQNPDVTRAGYKFRAESMQRI